MGPKVFSADEHLIVMFLKTKQSPAKMYNKTEMNCSLCDYLLQGCSGQVLQRFVTFYICLFCSIESLNQMQ